MEKYIKIYNEWLEDNNICFIQAAILSYLQTLQASGLYCYKSEKELAKRFKLKYSTFRVKLKELIDNQYIFKSQDKKYLIPYNNKKAIILVDDNNPIPTKDNATSTETYQKTKINDLTSVDIAKVKKVLKSEISKNNICDILSNAPKPVIPEHLKNLIN